MLLKGLWGTQEVVVPPDLAHELLGICWNGAVFLTREPLAFLPLCHLFKRHWRASTGDLSSPALWAGLTHAFTYFERSRLTCQSDGPRAWMLNRFVLGSPRKQLSASRLRLQMGQSGLCECTHCWRRPREILRSTLYFFERRKKGSHRSSHRVALISPWTVWKFWMERFSKRVSRSEGLSCWSKFWLIQLVLNEIVLLSHCSKPSNALSYNFKLQLVT